MNLREQNKIKNLVMSGHADCIRNLLLNESQIELIAYISLQSKKQIKTAELSSALRISVQNASQQLKTLFNKGYLSRKTVTAKSGGNEWVYRSNW